jgi:hypothetical protein
MGRSTEYDSLTWIERVLKVQARQFLDQLDKWLRYRRVKVSARTISWQWIVHGNIVLSLGS